MSSISSVSNNPTVLQLLALQSEAAAAQEVNNNIAADRADRVNGTDSVDNALAPNDFNERLNRFNSALEDQGTAATPLSDLRSNLDTALQSARVEGTDPRDAVDGVLGEAGVDLDAFHREIDPLTGRIEGTDGQSLGLPPDGPRAIDATDATSTDDDGAIRATSPVSATNSLDGLLNGTGVDPAQFEASLATLINNNNASSDGSDSSNSDTATDTAPLFAAATVGSSLDIAG